MSPVSDDTIFAQTACQSPFAPQDHSSLPMRLQHPHLQMDSVMDSVKLEFLGYQNVPGPKVPLATILRETMTNSKRKAPASSEVQPLRPAFVDRLAPSVGLGITLAPVPTTPTMSFEEAEAILTSPLCSPNLKPSDSASLLSRPQLCIVDSTQPLDCFTQAASPVNGFPQPESRNSSISSVSSTFSDLSESRSGDMCNGAILSLIAFSQAPQVSTHHQPHHLALSTTTQAPPPQNLIWKPKQGETLRNQLLPSPSKANTTSLLQKAISAAPSVCVPSATQPENEKQRTRLTHEQREYMMRIFEIDHNPSSKVMRQVAETVGMRFRLVQYFYQNRRAALRRKSGKEV